MRGGNNLWTTAVAIFGQNDVEIASFKGIKRTFETNFYSLKYVRLSRFVSDFLECSI